MKPMYMFDCKKCTNKIFKGDGLFCIPLSQGKGEVMHFEGDNKLVCEVYTEGNKQQTIADWMIPNSN